MALINRGKEKLVTLTTKQYRKFVGGSHTVATGSGGVSPAFLKNIAAS
ncbi:hypothetical protein [Metarhizobium album]|nr:hypothetical protein [Rhizobium album]